MYECIKFMNWKSVSCVKPYLYIIKQTKREEKNYIATDSQSSGCDFRTAVLLQTAAL